MRVASRKAILGLVVGFLAGAIASAQTPPSLEGMRNDVERMEVSSNPDRGQAVMRMLEDRNIPYELEAFDIEPPEGYPRNIGGNIVVTLGEGPRDIVIGAHYDAVWLPNGRLSRGAVDNAASSVILTRLAEALTDASPGYRIRIVWFDMEEIGLRGSRSYLGRHGSDSIAAAINLDVNAYGDTLFYGPTAPEGNQTVHEALAQVCADADFSCMDFPRYPQSDYISFQRAGIPNVSLSVLPGDEASEFHTALNGTEAEIQALGAVPRVYRLIHSVADTSDEVDPAGMMVTYRAVLALVWKLAAGADQ